MKTLNLDSNLIDSKKSKKRSGKKSSDKSSRSKNPSSQTNSQKNQKLTANQQESNSSKPDSEKSPSNPQSIEKTSSRGADKHQTSKSKKGKKGLIKQFKKLKPIPKIIVTILICSVIGGVGGGITYWLIIRDSGSVRLKFPDQVTAETEEANNFANIKLPPPQPPKDQPNPINGELYTQKEIEEIKSRYPIAVMVENHIDARNQSGYNCADIIYETVVEGGITRTMPIFWGRKCDEIGPIRSARKYFIDWLIPYDALYMHIGYAISDDPDVDVASNLFTHGIKSLNKGGTFWRSNTKYSPHNAYSSSELLYEKADVYGYTGTPSEIEPLKFKKDAAADSRGNKDKVEITFFQRLHNGGIYDVTWTYDESRNVYLRHQGNDMTPYLDAATGNQVFAKNLVILRSKAISTYDYKAHMIIETIGEGDAILMRDGHTINATWKKPNLESRTRLYNDDGDEIKLNRGITWMIAVPIDQGSVTI